MTGALNAFASALPVGQSILVFRSWLGAPLLVRAGSVEAARPSAASRQLMSEIGWAPPQVAASLVPLRSGLVRRAIAVLEGDKSQQQLPEVVRQAGWEVVLPRPRPMCGLARSANSRLR